jgi:hypothetical protein
MSLEGALLRALWTYVPGPIIHLVAAPLVLLAWRSRVVPVRTAARIERDERFASARVAWSPGPPLAAATPNWDAVLRPSSLPAWAAGPGPAPFERANEEAVLEIPDDVMAPPAPVAPPPSVYVPPPASPPVSAPPPPPVRSVASAPPPPVRSVPPPPAPAPVAVTHEAPTVPDEPMVRVSLLKIAAQLPPDVFVLPPERLAESLREPHVLVVPRRLIVPQLAEGAVEIAWTLVEDQFPELALAVPAAEVRKRFPGWVISLPMDEVVRQIPADLLRLETPTPDLSDIGAFPAPFTPAPPAPEPEPALQSVEPASTPETPATELPLPVAPVVAVSVAPPLPAAPEPPAPAVTAPAVEVPAVVAEKTPEVVDVGADEESEALARTLELGLTPLGAFDWQTRRVGGRPLVSFVPPTLPREALDALAVSAAALIERLAPWAVEQVTIRTSRVACVVTPLGPRGCLAAAMRRNGAVAMLELVSARAARGAGARPTVASAGGTLTAVVTAPSGGGNGQRRLGEAARALAAFGPVASSVAEPAGGAPGVYVFADRDGGVLAGVARAVHEALVAGHDDDALGGLETVELRRGRERAVVRPLREQAGGPALLAAAGEVALAGRAHRAVARAAALLEAR